MHSAPPSLFYTVRTVNTTSEDREHPHYLILQISAWFVCDTAHVICMIPRLCQGLLSQHVNSHAAAFPVNHFPKTLTGKPQHDANVISTSCGRGRIPRISENIADWVTAPPAVLASCKVVGVSHGLQKGDRWCAAAFLFWPCLINMIREQSMCVSEQNTLQCLWRWCVWKLLHGNPSQKQNLT